MTRTHKELVKKTKKQRTRDKAARRLVVKLLSHGAKALPENTLSFENEKIYMRRPVQHETYDNKYIADLMIQIFERLNIGG
jgi:hypothetical protein